MKITKVSNFKNQLGEGVWWDDDNMLLHWTDILEGKLYSFNLKTQKETYKKFNGKLGCFAPCKNGDFLIGLDLSFYIYNPLTQNLSKFVDLKDEPLENRINDGTTDPKGRFWVGTMTSEGNTKKQSGSIYCISPDRKVKKFFNKIYTSNGIAFNKLGTKMYYADTGKDIQTIWYLDYDLENGIPSNKRVFSTTFNLKGRPDGATVDANDYYWVAGIEGSEIYRFNSNGEIDTVIPVPVEKPTKIVFGGNNLQSIYVTSIGKGFDNKSSLDGFTLEISTSKYKGYKTTKFDY